MPRGPVLRDARCKSDVGIRGGLWIVEVRFSLFHPHRARQLLGRFQTSSAALMLQVFVRNGWGESEPGNLVQSAINEAGLGQGRTPSRGKEKPGRARAASRRCGALLSSHLAEGRKLRQPRSQQFDSRARQRPTRCDITGLACEHMVLAACADQMAPHNSPGGPLFEPLERISLSPEMACCLGCTACGMTVTLACSDRGVEKI